MKLSALLLPLVVAFLSCPAICASRTLSGEGADAGFPSFDRSIFMLRYNAVGDSGTIMMTISSTLRLS